MGLLIFFLNAHFYTLIYVTKKKTETALTNFQKYIIAGSLN